MPKLLIYTRYPSHTSDVISTLIKDSLGKEKSIHIIIIKKAEDLKPFINLTNPHIFFLDEEGQDITRLSASVRKNSHRFILPKRNRGLTKFEATVLSMPDASLVRWAT